MTAVKRHQLLIAQLGNFSRFTTAVVVIGGGREQVGADALPQLGNGRRHGAFHLVVDHTFEFQCRVPILRVFQLQTMAFLGEIQRVQAREEHRIQIHIQQVVEVFVVLGSKRVGSPVAAGHGVHEGIQ